MLFEVKSEFIKIFMVFLSILNKNILKLILKKTRVNFLTTKQSLETKPLNDGSPILLFFLKKGTNYASSILYCKKIKETWSVGKASFGWVKHEILHMHLTFFFLFFLLFIFFFSFLYILHSSPWTRK